MVLGMIGGAKAALTLAAAIAVLFLASCATERSDLVVGSAGETEPGSGPPRAPEDLIGAPPEQLLATLGRPLLQRQERPAEIWQYRGRGCVLDVFFYAVAPDSKQVVHLEARDDAAHATAVAPCLTGVMQARVTS